MGTCVRYILWCSWMLVALSLAEAGVVDNLKESIAIGLKNDLTSLNVSIDAKAVKTFTKQCSRVKTVLRLHYGNILKKGGPDLRNLTIHFKTEDTRVVYKLDQTVKKILANPDFDRSKKLAIYVHGFTDNPNKNGFTTVSNALLEKGGYNTLALDSSSLIQSNYLKASSNVQFIGDKLGGVLRGFIDEGISEDQILIIGHSLGAHIGAFACKKVYELTKKRIGRLTGLDPAGPCFINLKDNLRLKKTDAKFVDVIHSNAGVLGIDKSLGHVDYYPNSGNNQPGCVLQSCSHSRAWRFYASSVQHPKLFIAKKCKSWEAFQKNDCKNNDISYMGFGSTPESSGDYYLATWSKAPYGLGEKGLQYTDRSVVKKVKKLNNVRKKVFGSYIDIKNDDQNDDKNDDENVDKNDDEKDDEKDDGGDDVDDDNNDGDDDDANDD